MSTKSKSIFSGMGGLIAALAGLVTVGVGLLTIGSQLGWFDTKKEPGPATGATEPRSGTGSGAAASSPEFTVSPESVSFAPGEAAQASITLRNTGNAPFTPQAPELDGSDPTEFQVTDVNCAGTALQPRASCRVNLTFSPSKAGSYDAEVVIPISGSSRQVEVPVDGEKGLL